MSDKGWIKLHRNIQNHWLYQEKREFSKFEAWTYVLMNVNHKDNKILFEGQLMDVKRGQVVTSEVKLSDKWGWGRKKVRNFLELLENDGMIIKITIPNKCTILEVVNYNNYQSDTREGTTQDVDITDIEGNEEQQKKQQRNNESTSEEQQWHNTGTIEEQQRNTNKNVKNVKEESLCMYDENFQEISNLYTDNIGPILPVTGEQLKSISEDVPHDLFKEAIKIAVDKKKRYINYIEGILKNWKDDNILTLTDLEAHRKEKEVEKVDKQQEYQKKKQPYIKPAAKTRFHNFEQRSDKYSNDQLEDIAARKRREYSERNKGNAAL